MNVGPALARKTWRTLEPLHGFVYFAPETKEAYTAVGLVGGRMGYFASRAAPMGAVPAEVVVATFFNFAPSVVAKSIPEAWKLATPAAVLEARLNVVDSALRRGLGDDSLTSPAMLEAAQLARRAAESATERPQGRPLFAGHAALPWPDDPHLQLWHAQSLLREFRGDAHVALLVAAGLSGCEALVVHGASGEVPLELLRLTRGWSEEDWAAAVDSVRSRGWLEPGDELTLNDAGRAARQEIEDRTDQLSAVAYAPLGEDGCERLREVARPLSKLVVSSGLLDPTLAPGLAED